MNDPHRDAQSRISTLLSRAKAGPLSAEACWRLVDDLRLVPGMMRQVAHALSAQLDAPALDALLTLPPGVPGVVEGAYRAMRSGVRRRRKDGKPYPAVLAMDFHHSRARWFHDAVRRAYAVFGDGLEHLRVDGKTAYRIRLHAERGTLAGRAAAAAHDVQWLHERLGRLKSSRLWLNGWRFVGDGPLRPAAQVHLVRGWLSWAASQTETRR